jgi:hypothetical protein
LDGSPDGVGDWVKSLSDSQSYLPLLVKRLKLQRQRFHPVVALMVAAFPYKAKHVRFTSPRRLAGNV